MARKDPYRNFRFKIQIKGVSVAKFSEITVPETTVANMQYRDGDDPTHVRQLSGLTSFGNVTLKRGITDEMGLQQWFEKVVDKGAESNREAITITLVDETGADKCQWDVTEAWPIKYEHSGFNATGNEVFIETLELVHEGITRKK